MSTQPSTVETSTDIDSCSMPAEDPVTVGDALGAAWMLAWREWVRFFRQRNRVTAAILQPLVFWLLFGTGLKGSFSGAGDLDFLQYFLPGTLGLIVLFTAIFSTISVIEDRREGFMQSVLVAPVGRLPVLLGKVVGGSVIAWVQAVAFLLLVLILGTVQWSASLIPLLVLMAFIAIAMCSLGMIVAWPMESTQGFHAIMMLGLMPMWLLSGSFFPIPMLGPKASLGQWILGGVMRANPLSYSMVEMRRLLFPEFSFGSAGFTPSPIACWVVTVVTAVLCTIVAWRLIRGSRKADVIV